MKTRTLLITNSKGGVAKTTTCLSLGSAFAEMGHRTLLVDLDPQGDLTTAVGLDVEALTWSVADLLDDTQDASKRRMAVYATAIDRMYILPANPRLDDVERQLHRQKGFEMRLAQELAPLNGIYEYVLLDSPPSLGGLVSMALSAAQWVIIPVQCEYYAARRLQRVFNVIAQVREKFNPKLAPAYLLATMYDQRTRISKDILEQLRQNFPENLLETLIGVDTRLRESPAAGEPIVLYAPRTRASEQYRQLAQELLEKLDSS
ncbi:MAG: ParA family protein [Anaerolineae bacterium]|nr:ParA family protein [Anaerolineae bacterium]